MAYVCANALRGASETAAVGGGALAEQIAQLNALEEELNAMIARSGVYLIPFTEQG